ncbi:MAG: hypothetical protein BV459_01945 [Thermoplasmata archaeon M11B2D]|nr:MAG: hypothetical protein BV459_01945 [Thermoplasmata archaeon M11B2D]
MADLYIIVNEKNPVPGRVPIGVANVGVIGFDDANQSKFISTSGVPIKEGNTRGFIIGSYDEFSNLYDGTPEETELVHWMQDYFNELDYQADAANVYFYRFLQSDGAGSATDENMLSAGGVTEWRTATSPIDTLTSIKVSYQVDASTGLPGTVTQPPAGYTVEEVNGTKTGKITFKTGYPVNAGSNPQPVGQEDSVLASYTTTGLAGALSVFNNADVQLMSLAYDHGSMSGSVSAQGIYGGTSFVNDMKQLLSHCNSRSNTGWQRQALISLPANQRPWDSGISYGAVGAWNQLRENDFGQTRNAIVVGFKNTLDTTRSYTASFDGGAAIAAMIRKKPVRGNIGGIAPSTAIPAYEDESTISAFEKARIGTIVKISHLVSSSFLNRGYTLGVGRQRWINNVRCRYQIKHLLMSGLLQLILEDITYNSEGMNDIIARISAIMKDAQIRGWHDGLVKIVIPIKRYLDIPINQRSASDKDIIAAAIDSGTVNNIEVVYLWGTNVEKIIISALGEI